MVLTAEVLFEGCSPKRRRAILESSANVMEAFKKFVLNEGKQMSAEEIDALFTAIEKNGGRTAIGKGVDTAKNAAVGIQNLWKMAQDSKPLRNFDAKWFKLVRSLRDKLNAGASVTKLGIATNAPDSKNPSAIVRAFNAYGEFAKKHPVLQLFFITALTALLVAIGPGGAVGVGIANATVRGIDSILKGERLTTALMKAAVWGAVGATIRSLADLMVENLVPIEKIAAPDLATPTYKITQLPTSLREAYEAAFAAARKLGLKAFTWLDENGVHHVSGTLYKGEPGYTAQQVAEFIKQDSKGMLKVVDLGKLTKTVLVPVTSTGAALPESLTKRSRRPIITESTQHRITTLRNGYQYVTLTPSEVDYLLEGVLDWAKKKASQMGSALTNKITKSALEKAWKQAGSPTDSDDIYAWLVAYKPEVLDQNTISRVYRELNIPSEHTRYPGPEDSAGGEETPSKLPEPAAEPEAGPKDTSTRSRFGFKRSKPGAPGFGGAEDAQYAGDSKRGGKNKTDDTYEYSKKEMRRIANTKDSDYTHPFPSTGEEADKAKPPVKKMYDGIISALKNFKFGDKENGVYAADKIMKLAQASYASNKLAGKWNAFSQLVDKEPLVRRGDKTFKAGSRSPVWDKERGAVTRADKLVSESSVGYLDIDQYRYIGALLAEYKLTWESLGLQTHIMESHIEGVFVTRKNSLTENTEFDAIVNRTKFLLENR